MKYMLLWKYKELLDYPRDELPTGDLLEEGPSVIRSFARYLQPSAFIKGRVSSKEAGKTPGVRDNFILWLRSG
jgi:hypothetical protein